MKKATIPFNSMQDGENPTISSTETKGGNWNKVNNLQSTRIPKNGAKSGQSEAVSRRETTSQKDSISLHSRRETDSRYLDLKQAAQYANMSFWTFREYVSAGLIPSIRLPHPFKTYEMLRRILIDPRDIDGFFERNKTGGNGHA